MWKAAHTIQDKRVGRYHGAKLLRSDDQLNVCHRYVLILTKSSRKAQQDIGYNDMRSKCIDGRGLLFKRSVK